MLGVIVVLDFFLVALVVNRSLDMFRSVRGTWLPFLLIFARRATARGSRTGGDTMPRAGRSRRRDDGAMSLLEPELTAEQQLSFPA